MGSSPPKGGNVSGGARVGGTSSGGMGVFCSFLRRHDRQIAPQPARAALSGHSMAVHYPGNGWSCLPPPARCGAEVKMRAGKVTPANSGASMGRWGLMRWSLFQTTPIRWGCGQRGVCPGEETPITPDEPDVLDADYALQGVEIDTWRRVRRVRRVVCCANSRRSCASPIAEAWPRVA